MSKVPLRTLRNSNFFTLYQRLLVGEGIGTAEGQALLKAAVIFLNHENLDVAALGYRIIVMYSNLTKDYVPLYDVALSKGYMPIVRSAEAMLLRDEGCEHFFPEYFSSMMELYRVGDAIFTEQQLNLSSFFRENNLADVTVTAPTSYGKSELISGFCNQNLKSNICVIVPTKALLAQTKQRLLSKRLSDDKRQVVTHAEMYQGGKNKIIAVLTQERLLRFFIKHPELSFDFVFVDEAHNLLGDDLRALLLAKVIVLQKSKNPESRIKFLTPFLVEQKNLRLRYTDFEVADFKVEDSIKTERYHVVDCRQDGVLYLYDQFLDGFVQCSATVFSDGMSFINKHAATKNIIFFNMPKKIEQFLRDFLPHLEVVESEGVSRVCESIANFLHSDYLLVEGLRKGILYHHGSVPDIVKLYVERAYSKIPEIKHIVCNSTLLEGVNIPAEKMFIFEKSKGLKNLSKSQFRNLVGRICRFSEIFDPSSGNLSLLEPKIYLVGTDDYLGSSANIRTFIKDVAQVDLKIKDQVDNVLLEEKTIEDEKDIEQKEEADAFLENILPGTTGLDIARATTAAGRACFLNNISEIDILQDESDIQQAIDSTDTPLEVSNDVLKLIATAFVPYLKDGYAFDILRRLKEPSAQSFYSMLIDWRIRGASYSEMINNFLRYWEQSGSKEVYVGKWGEIERENSFRKNWVVISKKTHAEKVNLAIVRIKEEQDFVDNHLLKYIELMNDLGKLDGDLYLKIKYGTTNSEKISLMNSGVNSYLATKLIDVYSDCVELVHGAGAVAVELKPKLINRMRENGENEILVFEAGLHLGLSHEF